MPGEMKERVWGPKLVPGRGSDEVPSDNWKDVSPIDSAIAAAMALMWMHVKLFLIGLDKTSPGYTITKIVVTHDYDPAADVTRVSAIVRYCNDPILELGE